MAKMVDRPSTNRGFHFRNIDSEGYTEVPQMIRIEKKFKGENFREGKDIFWRCNWLRVSPHRGRTRFQTFHTRSMYGARGSCFRRSKCKRGSSAPDNRLHQRANPDDDGRASTTTPQAITFIQCCLPAHRVIRILGCKRAFSSRMRSSLPTHIPGQRSIACTLIAAPAERTEFLRVVRR